MIATRLWIGWLAVALSVGTAQALDCKLDIATEETTEFTVRVICGNDLANAVSYPAGKLYLGMSLYAPSISVPSERKLELKTTDRGGALDLLPIEFEAAAGVQEFLFDTSERDGQTHFLAAVWDQRNGCTGLSSKRCDEFGFTLGRKDADGLPLPIDALPRPICDIDALEKTGLFKMIQRGEAYFDIQNVLPDEITTLLSANDCWSFERSRPGLGFSVRRWRVAPFAEQQ